MKSCLAALWATIVSILDGIRAFARAFTYLGEAAEVTAKGFRDEQVAEVEAEMEVLRKKLAAAKKTPPKPRAKKKTT